MIFRRANEKVGIGLDKLNVLYNKDGAFELGHRAGILLEFQCECSNEACTERISMKLNTYQKIHLNRDTFIVKPNHQIESIEKVVQTRANYLVVKKDHSVTEPGLKLNITSPLAV